MAKMTNMTTDLMVADGPPFRKTGAETVYYAAYINKYLTSPRQFSGPTNFRIVVPGLVSLDWDNATVHTATSVRKFADFFLYTVAS
jgi:hypothetical protein